MRKSLEGPSVSGGLSPQGIPAGHPLVLQSILGLFLKKSSSIKVRECVDIDKPLPRSWSFCETFNKLQVSITQPYTF